MASGHSIRSDLCGPNGLSVAPAAPLADVRSDQRQCHYDRGQQLLGEIAQEIYAKSAKCLERRPRGRNT